MAEFTGKPMTLEAYRQQFPRTPSQSIELYQNRTRRAWLGHELDRLQGVLGHGGDVGDVLQELLVLLSAHVRAA